MTVSRPGVTFGVPASTTVELIESELRIAGAEVQFDVFADEEYIGYVVETTDTTHRVGQRPLRPVGWIGSDNLGGTLLSSSAEAAYRCVAAVRDRSVR